MTDAEGERERSGASVAAAQTVTGEGKRYNMAHPVPVLRSAQKPDWRIARGLVTIPARPVLLDEWSAERPAQPARCQSERP